MQIGGGSEATSADIKAVVAEADSKYRVWMLRARLHAAALLIFDAKDVELELQQRASR